MPRENIYYRGPRSDHFDGVRFFNPGQPTTDRSILDLLRWQFAGRPAAKWPSAVPAKQVRPADRVGGLRVTAVGHSSLLIQVANVNVLTDPIWSDRASPVSFAAPKRVTAPGIAFEALPPVDIVLLSHSHYDHFDVATLRRLQAKFRPLFVGPLGMDALVGRMIANVRIEVGDWGDCFDLSDDISVRIVPANHWSSRSLSDRRMMLWCGFLVRAAGRQIYYAGDTGYGAGSIFRAMRDRYGACDLALIPIGAYAPRWFMQTQHVDPDEAVQIMLDCGALQALGIHWGTFRLTDEPRDEPLLRLANALQQGDLDPARFLPAGPGEVFDFD